MPCFPPARACRRGSVEFLYLVFTSPFVTTNQFPSSTFRGTIPASARIHPSPLSILMWQHLPAIPQEKKGKNKKKKKKNQICHSEAGKSWGDSLWLSETQICICIQIWQCTSVCLVLWFSVNSGASCAEKIVAFYKIRQLGKRHSSCAIMWFSKYPMYVEAGWEYCQHWRCLLTPIETIFTPAATPNQGNDVKYGGQ